MVIWKVSIKVISEQNYRTSFIFKRILPHLTGHLVLKPGFSRPENKMSDKITFICVFSNDWTGIRGSTL